LLPPENLRTNRALIFANGEFNHPESVKDYLRADDLIIAADGGTRHLLDLGLTPSVLIGDFDSLSADILASMETQGVETIRHPDHKDYTDLELALRLAANRGVREVFVFAAVGARWDQTLANLLLPTATGFEHLEIRLIDGPQEVALLSGGSSIQIHGQAGDTVSLIPIGGDAVGVTTDGLEYPLNREKLHFGETRGVSNILLGEVGSVSLQEGSLLCITIHTHD
jgi:thiamine pyrophosphokinase